ncbi:hypothetical protein KCP75_00225 [Salmonella enterica subsp. enterica]|nr:hypothetical protein KCP75_00225 [Salmonella enterica subsp. enterica]
MSLGRCDVINGNSHNASSNLQNMDRRRETLSPPDNSKTPVIGAAARYLKMRRGELRTLLLLEFPWQRNGPGKSLLAKHLSNTASHRGR